MRQYAVIGLGAFGRQVAEELSELGVELLVLDRDRELLEQFSHQQCWAGWHQHGSLAVLRYPLLPR